MIKETWPDVTLRELSFDKSNQEYLCNSEVMAVDFDKVKELYMNSFKLVNTQLCSVDAMFGSALLVGSEIAEPCLYFVEFKNGVVNKKEVEGVINKIKDSVYIYLDELEQTPSYLRNNAEFILVYNKEKNENLTTRARNSIGSSITGNSNTRHMRRFGYSACNGLYLKKFHTMNEDEFDRFLLESKFTQPIQ